MVMHRSREILALLLASMFLSCSSDRRTPQAESWADERPCARGCESNLWPRVIVGVSSPSMEQASAENLVRVRLRDERGVSLQGHLHGCPPAPGVVCSYSFF